MGHALLYVANERTARITPEAFRVRLEQSGFPVKSQRREGEDVELLTDGVVLWLVLEDGFVVEIECEVTFVNDRKSNRILELIESMGWVAVED